MAIESTNTRKKIETGIYQRAGNLLIKVTWQGQTSYEPTGIEYTARNLAAARRLHDDVHDAIVMGTFTFADFFPKSKKARGLTTQSTSMKAIAELWFKTWGRSAKEEGAAQATFNCYDAVIRCHIIPHIGTLPITSITAIRLEQFFSSLVNSKTGEPLGHKRIDNVRTTMNQIFQFAASRKVFKGANPFDEYEALRVAGKAKTKAKQKEGEGVESLEPFKKNERAALENAFVYESDRNMVMFNFAMGLRLGECFGLCWDKVDLEAGTIQVHRQMSEGRFQECKSQSNRTLVISSEAMVWLKKQKELILQSKPVTMQLAFYDQRAKEMKNKTLENLRFVFPNPCTGEAYKRSDNFQPRWYKALTKAGIEHAINGRKRTPNTMRHTMASRMVSAGATVDETATQLGNTPGACGKYYAKDTGENMQTKKSRLDSLMEAL